MRPSRTAVINAVQDDRYSRNLELSLYADEVPWNIPENTHVLIRYSKNDGKGGEYDTLPDGTAAWSAEGNQLTLALAPQVLTVPGPVSLSVRLVLEEKELSTFSILIHVQAKVCTQIPESENYYHVTAYLPAPASAKKGQFFRILSVDGQGKVTALEAVNEEDIRTDLTGYATEQWVRDGYQERGNYLTEHQDISGKLDADQLPEAINDALAQAKASGEFNGDSSVYTLAEGETAEDAPEWATVVVDPYTEPASVEMTATLDDGTSVTYKLCGEAVTG